MEDPLIVTLRFDAASFAVFDGLRHKHFPAARNLIPAHLTLFHHLPGQEIETVRNALGAAVADVEAIPLAVTGLRFLGYGSAFTVASPRLIALRADLATGFASWLTPQDAQRFQPHVTIQNKAPAAQAKALFAELDASFRPFEATGVGLDLWHYRGGPWETAGTFAIGGEPNDGPPRS